MYKFVGSELYKNIQLLEKSNKEAPPLNQTVTGTMSDRTKTYKSTISDE